MSALPESGHSIFAEITNMTVRFRPEAVALVADSPSLNYAFPNNDHKRSMIMKKLNVKRWAAVAEIFESVAVIVSLIFVAYSVNRNTLVMQAANDTFVYQIQDERVRDIANSSELASIELKVRNNEEVSEVDKHRMISQHLRELNMWELAYVQYNQGMYSPDQWIAWNTYYGIDLTAKLPKKWWEEVRPWYGEDFRVHVDGAYANK